MALSFIPRFAALNERYDAEVPLLLGVGILLFYLAIAVNYVIGSFEVARESERLALEHEILAREAELKALRAQIDPHFLFNSLNSVSSLIATDSAGARRMCLLLADFLRKSISLGAQQNISLVEEIALVSSFLAIERVRFGSRLRIEQEIDEASKDCLVPPLLLQPLVENAVNHGVAQLIEGGTIHIKTERRGDRLRIAIDNPCDRERPQATRQGLGLQNVRSRLATLHGSESRVNVQEKDGHFRVELTLPAVFENKPPLDPPNTTGRDREPLATRRSRP
jgi:LytS/YehU family sensor histidine kinase